MNSIIKKSDLIILYVVVGLVYLAGMFIPLMENDAAQHARTAMRMFQLNDFINLYRYDVPYLDKPHLHFWLAALSYKVFGLSHFAYRLPSVLITLLGAISAGQLAKILYGEKAKHLAALIFLTAQTIILANHDVRTDAVLTGMTIFALWQIIRYFKTGTVWAIVLGALGASMAFCSKGHLATFVIGVCVTVFAIQYKSWSRILHWKFLLGILLWFVFASPVLYAYYIQYDLNGTLYKGEHVSGLKFILWDQNFQRFNGTSFGSNSPDYFFFLHTILWAFFPWPILMILALGQKVKSFKTLKIGETDYSKELMTSIGFAIVFCFMSMSKFKLPHYLNSLIPILGVLVSGYIVKFIDKEEGEGSVNKFLKYFQPIIISLGIVLVTILSIWAFPELNFGYILGMLILIIGILVWVMYTKSDKRYRWIFITIYGIALANFCLNVHFYPNLLQYQAGSSAAKVVNAEGIDVNKLFFIRGNRASWALEFYTQKQIGSLTQKEAVEKLEDGEEFWLYGYDVNKKKRVGIPEEVKPFISRKIDISHYPITKLKLSFLNPNTRDEKVKKAYLLRITPKK